MSVKISTVVFTSGAIMEEEAFPAGHKTPPVEFKVGGVILRSLRNLSILRKK